MGKRAKKKKSGIVTFSVLLMLFLLAPFYPTSAYLHDRAEQKVGISLTLGNLKEAILRTSTGTYEDEVLLAGEMRPGQNQKTVTFTSTLKNTGSLDSNHAFKIEVMKPSNLSEANFEAEKKNITAKVVKSGKVIFQGKLSELRFGQYTGIEFDSLKPQETYTLETTLSYEGKQSSSKSYDLEFIVTAMAMQTNKTDVSPQVMFHDYSKIRHRVGVTLKRDAEGFEYFSNEGHFTYTLKDLDMYYGRDVNGQTATLNSGKVRIYIPEGFEYADLRFTTVLGENGTRLVQHGAVDFNPTTRIATLKYRLTGDGNQSAWMFSGQITVEEKGRDVPGQYGVVDQVHFNDQNTRRGIARKLYLGTDSIAPGASMPPAVNEADILVGALTSEGVRLVVLDRAEGSVNPRFIDHVVNRSTETITARLSGKGNHFTLTGNHPYVITSQNNGNNSDVLEITFTGDTGQKILIVRVVRNRI